MDEGSFLYGTDVSEARVVRDFHNFICNFREEGAPVEERSLYLQELDKRWEEETNHKKGIKFAIKGSHIAMFAERLYNNLDLPHRGHPDFRPRAVEHLYEGAE
jgi:hypothetical protein